MTQDRAITFDEDEVRGGTRRFPPGTVKLKITEAEYGEQELTRLNGQGTVNKAVVWLSIEGLAPGSVVGVTDRPMWVIGSDEDPMAEQDDTLKRALGSRQMHNASLKDVCKACGVKIAGSMMAIMNELQGKEAIVAIEHRQGKKDFMNAKYVAWFDVATGPELEVREAPARAQGGPVPLPPGAAGPSAAPRRAGTR